MKYNNWNIDNLHNFSFGLVLLSIPFPMIINNIAIFIFLFFSIFKLKNFKLYKNPAAYFFPSLFILSVFSLLYSCNLLEGIKDLEKILSFVLFFVCIPTLSLNKTQLNRLLNSFANVCLLLLLYCFVVAIYHVIATNSFYIFNPKNLVNENYFLYHRFSSSIGLHAAYLGIFLVFASCILIYNFKTFSKKNRTITILKLLILALGIYLLQTFSVMAAYFIILIAAPFLLKNHISTFKKITFLLLIFILPASIFLNKAKAVDTSFLNYNHTDDIHNRNWNSLNIRLAKWDCALSVAKESIFIGQGIGCTQDNLNKMYLKKGFEIGYGKNYSTHNQYIHYLVELGLIGALLFITFLIISFYQIVINKNFLMFSILTLLAICSVTENVLTLNKGIVFFSIFYYLIFYKNEQE